ncbi:hypothetical protein Mapa_005130 [Marchantia paleacea]|nr:hypothetical protein Mapa_005130 [Marchantia paleacea]
METQASHQTRHEGCCQTDQHELCNAEKFPASCFGKSHGQYALGRARTPRPQSRGPACCVQDHVVETVRNVPAVDRRFLAHGEVCSEAFIVELGGVSRRVLNV